MTTENTATETPTENIPTPELETPTEEASVPEELDLGLDVEEETNSTEETEEKPTLDFDTALKDMKPDFKPFVDAMKEVYAADTQKSLATALAAAQQTIESHLKKTVVPKVKAALGSRTTAPRAEPEKSSRVTRAYQGF